MGNESKRRGNSNFTRIKYEYGEHVASDMNKNSNSKILLTNKFNQRILPLRCRKEKIIPQNLRFNVFPSILFDNSNIASKHTSVIKKLILSILNLEIKDICITIHILQRTLKSTEKKIIQSVSEKICKKFFAFELEEANKMFLSHKNKCKSKFERLKKIGTSDSTYNDVNSHPCLFDSWFVNLTDIDIPTAVTKTISLGKNFGIPYPFNKIPTKHRYCRF